MPQGQQGVSPRAWQPQQPQQPQQPWQGYQAPQGHPSQQQPQQPWQGYQAPPRPKRMGVGAWIAIGGALAIFLLVGFVLLGNRFNTPAGGGSGSPNSASGGTQDSGMGFEYGVTYGLAVPGVAYTQQAGGDKVRYVVSSGVKTKSALQIKPDGTYYWDSAWDGKVIKGTWEKTGDPGYPIVLLKAQEGKDWRVGPDTRKGANPGTILVWEGSIYYEGFPLK